MQPKSGQPGQPRPEKFAGCVVLLLALAGSGCGPATTTAPATSAPFAGRTVRVACPGDPAAAILHRYGQPWALRTGARLEMVHYDPATGPIQAGADAWVIAPAELGRWASLAKLRPVPEAHISLIPENPYEWGDLLPLYRTRLLVWDTRPYALPLLGDAQLCFFRSDLLRDPEQQSVFRKKYDRELAPPRTWEEFADLAVYFQGALGKPSLPPLPAADADLDRLFFGIAAPCVVRGVPQGGSAGQSDQQLYSFQYNLTTGSPRLGSPGFLHALRLLQRLQLHRPAGTTDDPVTAVLSGNAVFCLASPSNIARFEEAGSPVQGKVDFCRVPGSRTVFSHAGSAVEMNSEVNHVPYLGAGGWLGVVPVSSDQPEAAFSLLAELGSRKTSREIVFEPHWGGGAFRRSHFDKVEEWYSFGLGADQTAKLRQLVRDSLDPLPLNPALRLRVPDEKELRQALVQELRAALLQGKDASEALKDATHAWEQLDARKGKETRLAEYRFSLGR